MAKKKNWIDRLKKFFISEAQPKQENKERRRRWLFGKLKSKLSPALPAPSLQRLRSLTEAEQEQSKHAVAVAVATAAAAEAAVAAAQAAVQVVRLTKNPLSYHQTENAAAIKIQTVFRGYLARRALRALKGLVKLQALIRGQAVRSQTKITLKGLQSLMKIQSQARANRMRVAANLQSHEVKNVLYVKTMENKESGHTQAEYNDRRWDGSVFSKEEIIALLKKRQEAAFKRERAMEYASTHQRRHAGRPIIQVDHASDTSTLNPKWSWLERWVDAQPLDEDIHEISPIPCQFQSSESLGFVDSADEGKAEEVELRYLARRSFNRSRRALLKDDDSLSSSPYFPIYMASTASTKAKFRSVSMPKQRRGTLDCSDHRSLSRDRLSSPLPSVKASLNHLRSPKLRDSAGTAKHYRSSNYFGIDSQRSLLSWGMLSPSR